MSAVGAQQLYGPSRLERRDLPLVSVGMPVHNGEAYVGRAIESILAQDYDNLELVLSDNGSEDRTAEICARFADADPRVRFHRVATNRGAAWNYNHVLKLAAGPLFKWAAADDECEPTFLSSCVDALLSSRPDTALAFPSSVLIDETGEVAEAVDDSNLDLRHPRPEERVAQLLANRFEWHPVFGVMKTNVLRTTAGIGRFVLADVVLLVELAMRGQFVRLETQAFRRRYHGGRPLVSTTDFRKQAEWYDPSHQRRVVLPQTRLAGELVLAVRRAPLTTSQRRACMDAAARAWILPHTRHMGGELKLAAKHLLRPSVPLRPVVR